MLSDAPYQYSSCVSPIDMQYQEAVKKFAEYRNNILKQLKGVIRHHG
jgi:hypothetical protein